MLIRLDIKENKQDKIIYINPDKICSIVEDLLNEDMYCIHFVDGPAFLLLKENVDQILKHQKENICKMKKIIATTLSALGMQ